MNFFDSIWDIINEGNKNKKIAKFNEFYKKYKNTKDINFNRVGEPKSLEKPCYSDFCDVVSMRNLNKKIPQKDKNLYFIHSVAHIEFSAIDIALDECYRFDLMSRDFYDDWLEVADDEVRHFLMIEDLLAKNGGYYGCMQVHDGLFVALKKTENSLLERMALLPRYMEANGLDANAHIIKKLKKQNASIELINALQIILDEEIDHVKKGDKWFKYACKIENIDPLEYVNIIQRLYPNSFLTSRELNEEDRLKAGFSMDEIKIIKQMAIR
ncbi:ferritin [Campylobacter pinnipediorum subsp. pinnipediorum]|uniref:Ferritin n=1 Tax=Campylobacter pinnipediorum subsp. pinnipediorum TaxID=1660067 RepID=A0AAX0LAK3_9BACT|nr:ferritin-like domain-containing protein [Campylobacter pinnipediorum]OPA77150.1 ferritin [Campylobacter pinnipediorum subsp. pinnipediorum]OPA78936.1 ferritin [Campylobacter pinnipediorum subsp. pinnipediorum]